MVAEQNQTNHFFKKKVGFILAFEQTSVPARIELLLLNVSCTKPQQVVTLNFVMQ